MLMSIRVDSKEGLIEHVYKHFDEVKAVQEAYNCIYKMDIIARKKSLLARMSMRLEKQKQQVLKANGNVHLKLNSV